MSQTARWKLAVTIGAGVLVLSGCAGATEATPAPATTPEPTLSAVVPTRPPSPTPSATPSCVTDDDDVAAAVEAAISHLPAPSIPGLDGLEWDATTADSSGFDACQALSWIVVTVANGTASSPSQVAFFRDGEYLAPASETAYGFWPEVVRVDESTADVAYSYIAGDEPNAAPEGHTTVTFSLDDATGQLTVTGEFPPAP